jgi:predicted transcriptional regulator
MTSLMFQLRRSPRTLLERDGHPGPGPGRLALVMGRAGVGKTALIVGIGIDALLSGQRVLHVSLERTVDKIRDWYDDLLMELLRRDRKLQHWGAIQLEMERRRHIYTFVGHSFSIERLRQALDLLTGSMDFSPDVIILDRLEFTELEPAAIEALRDLAAELGAEIWMACRTHREGPQARPGHLPPPAEPFEELVDLAFQLDPREAKVRLSLLKDHQQMLDKDLNILLDPQTLLLVTGISSKR